MNEYLKPWHPPESTTILSNLFGCFSLRLISLCIALGVADKENACWIDEKWPAASLMDSVLSEVFVENRWWLNRLIQVSNLVPVDLNKCISLNAWMNGMMKGMISMDVMTDNDRYDDLIGFCCLMMRESNRRWQSEGALVRPLTQFHTNQSFPYSYSSDDSRMIAKLWKWQ